MNEKYVDIYQFPLPIMQTFFGLVQAILEFSKLWLFIKILRIKGLKDCKCSKHSLLDEFKFWTDKENANVETTTR